MLSRCDINKTRGTGVMLATFYITRWDDTTRNNLVAFRDAARLFSRNLELSCKHYMPSVTLPAYMKDNTWKAIGS